MTTPHTSVMLDEMIQAFSGQKIRTFFDGTLGAGGHAKAMLEAHPEIELFIGCDRDQNALKIAAEVLAPWKDKVRLMHGNFADLDVMLDSIGVKEVDGFFLT